MRRFLLLLTAVTISVGTIPTESSGRKPVIASDAAGRRIADGSPPRAWDGRNNAGVAVSSGVYFYRMVAGSFSEARRMVLLK